jgi:hypothetical protein
MWKTLLYYPLLSSAAVAKSALHRLQTTQTVTMAAEKAMGIQRFRQARTNCVVSCILPKTMI